MIQTGFEPRVKVQEIISNQLPSFILDENPKAVDFFKQYYISQEYQGGPSDLTENLDQYLKVDNLTPDVVVDSTKTVGVVTTGDSTINVNSTKGFPDTYGLLKINDEIITYTGITTNSFTGCVRGFSGITGYHQQTEQEELIFSESTAAQHSDSSSIQNLSTLFLKEFYKKLKTTFTPGLEDVDFTPSLNAGNFIKEARSLYESKGTDESFKILCKVLYGIDPTIVNLENYLIKPSSAKYIRRFVTIAEALSGNPNKLVGQTLYKSTDLATNASISEVEPFNSGGDQYFKISLFIGYDDLSTVQGTFIITPSSKATDVVSAGSSVLPVDSTIGFAESGYVISGVNSVRYTDKSVNQFFGCTGIGVSINPTDNVRSDETYFGYEDGDSSKKVTLRLTGVLSKFEQTSSNLRVLEGDIIGVKNLGSKIKNPATNKTHKEIFANSWIYNTSSRYKINDISNYTLLSKIDKSSLKKGDRVEILERGGQIVKSSTTNIAYIGSIIDSENRVSLNDLSFTAASGQTYDLRRKLNTASSSNTSMLYGNNTTLSDVLNVYDERGNYAYVASNSLPSSNRTGATSIDYAYEISKEVNTIRVGTGTEISLADGSTDGTYGSIKFANAVPFIEGDRIFYQPDVAPLVGLETGSYYVSIVSSDNKTINLYASRSFVGGSNNVRFKPQSDGHQFTLYSQRSNVIAPQKILKKFTLNPNIKNGSGEETIPGTTGMLINGVEISNYKSDDKIYYGPLESVDLLNGGTGYDAINLPEVTISSPGTGTTALVTPVVSGSFEKIYVDPQEFDINSVVSIGITGGNGTGAVLAAKLSNRFRNIFFDARNTTVGGGINTVTNQIIFNESHNLVNGEELLYSSEGNTNVGIGTSTLTLVDRASYFAKVDNNRTVQLFQSKDDLNNLTNVVNLTNPGNGIQKFSPAKSKKTITSIDVIDGGSGYTNRNLIVKSVGINTGNNTINFNNHGFADGDTINYVNIDGTAWTSPDVVGFVTTQTYKVLKVDDNSFKLSNLGIGGTDLIKYNQREFIRFETPGSGLHSFKFPDIAVNVEYTSVGFGTTTQSYQSISATPVVRGSIIDAYLHEPGTGYGSTILNLERKPLITIKTGKEAQIEPFIVNGKIEIVTITSGGTEYFSLPDIEITDPTGVGVGADIRPIISGGKLTDVVIVNAGIGYSTDTTLRVKSVGINGLLQANVRPLNIMNNVRFGNELLKETTNKLQYSILGYFDTLRTAFKEDSTVSSGIIGWAYDGNPIYGPFSYSDPADMNSSVRRMVSGYELNTSNITNRPPDFTAGFFAEDYEFTNNGDLDEYNGRFAKTAEFPEGAYAYYATLDASSNPIFPYFIGNKYRSNTLSDNHSINQSFDFNNSNLLRNTFPYKVADVDADNDFITETSELVQQKSMVESQTRGSVTGFDIVNSGDGYKVDEVLDFDQTKTGGGLIARVERVDGKTVTNINTTIEEFNNAIFTLDDDKKVKITLLPNHSFLTGEKIVVSGFSTSLSQLNDIFEVGVTSFRESLIADVVAGTSGVSTEIYVSRIPKGVAINSRIGIGTETLTVLEIFDKNNIIKVERGVTGLAHTATTPVLFNPDSFTIDSSLEFFDSKVNNRVYFNPVESVGVGTTAGFANSVTFSFGAGTVTRNLPTQSIYLEGHPFETNQRVNYTASGGNISISTNATVPLVDAFNLPSSVFVVNKTINTIGLKTAIDGPEVFFRSNGSDNDKYFFESDFTQITGKIQKVVSEVTTSSNHGLTVGDSVKLNVKPSLSVGIGTSAFVKVQRNTSNNNLQINPLTFASAGINTVKNQITINNHGLKTGDKVDYDATTIASGLSTNTYFVFRVDDNTFKLCSTKVNVNSTPPVVVDITGIGAGTHTLSPINPQIKSVKNNNLVFDLSDASLNGYNFKIFYDNDFKNEVVSISTSGPFTISGFGTPGVTAGAAATVTFDKDLPTNLYYNLEKSGYISTADKEVTNFSEILYIDSSYIGDYLVSPFGFTSSSFKVFLDEVPEKLSYASTECSVLKYTTSSKTASGPIAKVNIVSGGSNYEKLPTFTDVKNSSGSDAYVVPVSDDIGNAKGVRVLNEGFEYSSDLTLQPTAAVDTFVTIKDSNTIGIVSITQGGKGYFTAPTVSVVNPLTRKKIDNGIISVELTSNAITNVIIEQEPKGLPEDTVELFTENNDNGVSVQKVISNQNSGIITCHITTPAVGFAVNPFKAGDEVFVEGITNYTTTGTGFNSPDIGYRFYTVTNYDTTSGVLDRVTMQASQYITNAGLAKTEQGAIPVIINKNDYPLFSVTQKRSFFTIGEKLTVNGVETPLVVTFSDDAFVKVKGDYDLDVNDVLTVKGDDSGNIATVVEVENGEGLFKVDYNLNKAIGWENDTGKLDLDDQVVSDNDYYQNLSYAIKSPLTYKETTEVIKGILHTSGLKDFADTGITSTSEAGLGSRKNGDIIGDGGVDDETSIFKDFISETRVDTLYEFDLSRDIDVTDNKSKFIEFKNKKLTDYIECRSNRVLTIDNINQQFSNLDGDPSTFVNLIEFDSGKSFYGVLAQITDTNGNELQLSDLVVLESGGSHYLFERGTVVNRGSDLFHNDGEVLGEFSTVTDSLGVTNLVFTPTEKFETDYDIKLRLVDFASSVAGIGTENFGVVQLTSANGRTTQTGITTTLFTADAANFKGLFADIQVIDQDTDDMNFVSVYFNHDGTDTFISEYYNDTDTVGDFSLDEIGEFGGSIQSGIVSFTYTSDTNNQVNIRSRIVGFGTTAQGTGTHRFKSFGQSDGSERSVIYQSGFTTNVSAASTILSLSGDFNTVKSFVKVSAGNTSALHQVMLIKDTDQDLYLQQSPFLSIGSTSGIGTFTADMNGSNMILKFTPDSSITADVSIFSECFYKEMDFVNLPLAFQYGNSNSINETVFYKFYNAINGDRINRTEFKITHNSVPIFAKKFNPSDTSLLDLGTGKFTIDNHFFQNGEELIYTPEATFVGVGSTPMQYRSSAGVEGTLPTTVFAIVSGDPNSFFISTTKAGTAVTFTSIGEGNAHMLEMKKKNSKSLIAVDNIVQYPITFSPINHALNDNGGSIGLTTSVFALAGIASIRPADVLRVDTEYMVVQNVGFGTTSVGPITNSGRVPLVEVERGKLGTRATTHNDITGIATVHTGGYNLKGDEIYFTQPPRGNPQIDITESNLETATSDFNGRVYLRQDYTTNRVYDDISNEFTGIGQTFDLSVGGVSTAGIGTTGGNGILFINGIFQTPTTVNNPSNNFSIIEDNVAGVSSVVFSGIRDTNGDQFTSISDVNIGQLPRGGMIVSLGSSGGLGYAPLSGAVIAPTIGANGSIGSVVVGFGSTSDIKDVTDGYMISTATYNHNTGVLEVTTQEPHKLRQNDGEVFMEGLHFECAAQHAGVTTTIFPDGSSPFGQRFPVLGITSATTFTANVGICTIPHNYVGFGSIYSFLNLSIGSGYRDGHVSVAVTDTVYEHRFVSAGVNSITDNAAGTHTATDASYDSATGILKLTIPNHGLTDANTIGIATGGIVFSCSRDNYATNHAYPRAISLTRKRRGLTAGDPAHNANLGITTFTTNTISVGVGSGGGAGSGAAINHTVGVGGTLGFTIASAGSEYVNPEIFVSEPTYENLEIEGISRIGLGNTTDTGLGLLLDIEVGASSTTGIGSTYHEVTGFSIVRPGYSFKKGDVFRPVGLVTAKELAQPLEEYTLTVSEIFTDNFGSWQFGELDYIDSIKNLQDGVRKRFPLFYNNQLLSFETEDNSDIDIAASLLIIIDGVVQEPNVAYTFEGGTQFSLTAAPKEEAQVDIFFYRGTRGTDTVLITTVNQIIEKGDQVQLMKNNAIRTTESQEKRTVFNLNTSDRIETNRYGDEGIDETNYKPINIIKQKSDQVINGERVFKTRDSIEGQVFPVSKVIGDFSTTDTEIFLDNADLFDYGTPASIGFIAVAGIGSTDAVGNVEFISGATSIQGFSGIITGITTSAGTGGHPLALEFTLKQASFADLNVGFPIYIEDTIIGTGVTSVFGSDSDVVAIGQTFMDNVYNIAALHTDGTTGIITCNIHSASPVAGLSTFGDDNNPVGKFSWGRLSGFSRGSSPISIGVTGLTIPSTSVGISTFPIVQRRGTGLRDTGSLPKQL